MRLSIRNQLDGVIETVARGEVMATIGVRLTGGQDITAAITLDAVDDLKLEDGQPVVVLFKSTESAVATEAVAGLSIRNQITGTISAITFGSVMTIVTIDIAGGQTVTAVITKDAAQDLGLASGDPVTVLVKSTEVSVGVA
jgi:molybdate transport system regulatory protein